MASAAHNPAWYRPTILRRTAKRSARTASPATAPATTSAVKLEPNTRRKAAWKYGVNGPNQ